MYIYRFKKRGYVHERADRPLQDSIYRVKRKGIAAMCLCDGAGSYLLTDIGAYELSRTLARWMCGNFHIMKIENDDKKLAYDAANIIAALVDSLRKKYGVCEEHAFASTAICCAMNAATGEYIALHLGDGLLAGHIDGAFSALTPVESHSAGESMSATTLSHMGRMTLAWSIRISRGTADCILMASDGASGKLYNPKDNRVLPIGDRLLEGMKLIGPHRAQMLLEKTAETAFMGLDDLSIGLMIADEYPSPEKLGWTPAQQNALRRRRSMKSFEIYARMRDAGRSPQEAASYAHWGKNRKWKIKQAEKALNVY